MASKIVEIDLITKTVLNHLVFGQTLGSLRNSVKEGYRIA